jgi:hypothetical protein
MSRGVVIVACGNKIYGNMALNLAVSIKTNAPCNITLLWSEDSLSDLDEKQLKYFDNKIEVPESYYVVNGTKSYQRIKCYANEFSPYQETILIDADTIWNFGKNINDIFSELSETEFQVGCLGIYRDGKHTFGKYTYWGDAQQITEYWNLKYLYKTYSGFIYWKKNTLHIWQNIQLAFDDNNAPKKKWREHFPDEYGFNVGIPLSQVKMRHEYMPVFFAFASSGYTEHALKRNYSAISVSGGEPDPFLVTIYNRIVREYIYRTGINMFEHVNKKGTCF